LEAASCRWQKLEFDKTNPIAQRAMSEEEAMMASQTAMSEVELTSAACRGAWFTVIEDYSPYAPEQDGVLPQHAEPQWGYMELRRGQRVFVVADSRADGEAGCRFPAYVYAFQDGGWVPKQDGGWVPAESFLQGEDIERRYLETYLPLALPDFREEAMPMRDFLCNFPTSTAGLEQALLRDMSTIEVELERARALLAVSSNGYELKNVSEQWRADRSIVLAAVQHSGEALRFASSEFVQDSIVVLAAVQSNPSALRFAARQFEGARQVVIAAVQRDPEVIEWADAAFTRDPEILLHALGGQQLQYTCPTGSALAGGHQGVRAGEFLGRFDQKLVARLSKAVFVEWVDRLILNGDEKAKERGRRWQQWHEHWTSLSSADYADWATSKVNRRTALLVLHRSNPFGCLRPALRACVLKFL